MTDQFPIVEAVVADPALTTMTLVDSPRHQPFPRPRGNCFSLIDVAGGDKDQLVRRVVDGDDFRVLNMYAENFQELCRQHAGLPNLRVLRTATPLRCYLLIADPRVPQAWYTMQCCTICGPYNLATLAQTTYPECFAVRP